MIKLDNKFTSDFKDHIKEMIQEDISFRKKKGIYYLLDSKNKVIKQSAWLGNIFCSQYDKIMKKKIFPKKFHASINLHYEILNKEFSQINNKTIIDIACGSGNAACFVNKKNYYTGIDISKGLLKIAVKKFKNKNYKTPNLVLANACNLPFKDNCFDIGICNLSINFFDKLDVFIIELKRVLKPNSVFYCSVPTLERKNPKAKINGTIYTTDELSKLFEKQNFRFEALPYKNGALLYFKAILSE